MSRIAATQAELNHLHSFRDMRIGMVTVAMRDGRHLRGVISHERLEHRSMSITVLDEEGREHEIDLLDALVVSPAEPTDKMRSVLAARGMLSN